MLLRVDWHCKVARCLLIFCFFFFCDLQFILYSRLAKLKGISSQLLLWPPVITIFKRNEYSPKVKGLCSTFLNELFLPPCFMHPTRPLLINEEKKINYWISWTSQKRVFIVAANWLPKEIVEVAKYSRTRNFWFTARSPIHKSLFNFFNYYTEASHSMHDIVLFSIPPFVALLSMDIKSSFLALIAAEHEEIWAYMHV